MKGYFFLFLLTELLFCNSCKKSQAPYIDMVIGRYKVSGSVALDSAHIRNYTDTLIPIDKIDDNTIGFVIGGCDLTLWHTNWVYSSENDTSITYYFTTVGDHSPDYGSLQFSNPPNGSFVLASTYYCGMVFNNCNLHGVKVQ